MHQILVILSCVIFVIDINGKSVKLSASFDDDTIELTPLLEKYWSLRYAVLRNYQPLALCKFIDDCCETEERSKAISLMFSSPGIDDDSPFSNILNRCSKSTALKKGDQLCPSLKQLSSIPYIGEKNDPLVRQFTDLMMKHNEELNPIQKLLDRMEKSCNDYEFHAVHCVSDKKLLQSCVGKMLKNLHDFIGDEYYNEIIIIIKQNLINMNQKMIELSLDNTNIN